MPPDGIITQTLTASNITQEGEHPVAVNGTEAGTLEVVAVGGGGVS